MATTTPDAAPLTPRTVARDASSLWWLELIAGIAWILIALAILQFDQASITTVGVLIGVMFLVSGFQQFAVGSLVERGSWLFYIFGVLFLAAGVWCLFNPENSFAGLADVLGFLFVVVGVFWTVRAFTDRDVNPLWWVGLISGILMIVLGFWTSGQFFIEKAYVLLVFAGIWALMHGVTDIFGAFALRSVHKRL